MDPAQEVTSTDLGETLGRLARRLSRPMSLWQLGRAVAAECRTLFGHDAFFLSVLEESGEYSVTIYAEDTRPGGSAPEPVNDPPAPRGQWKRHLSWADEPLLISRREDAKRPPTSPFGFAERRSASLMFAPIFWEEAQVGVISVQSYTPGRYGPAEFDLLKSVTAQCGLILAHLRVEQKIRVEGRVERIKTRRALRQSQEQLRAIVRLASDGIFIKDRKGRFVLTNPAYASLFGLTPDQTVGKTSEDLFGPQKAREIVETDRQIMETLSPRWNELVRRQGMADQVLHTVKVPYLSPDGELLGVIGITRDVTEQRRTETRMRENQDRLELINAIARAITTGASSEAIIRSTVDRLRDLFSTRVTYRTVDAQGRATLVASASPEGMTPPDEAILELSAVPLYLAELRRGLGLAVEDVGRDARFAPLADRLPHVGALLEVPLMHEGRVDALLALTLPHPHSWSVQQITCLKEAADYLAIAVRNATTADLYETLLEAQSDLGLGVGLMEEDRFISANPALCAMVGYGREEFMALPSHHALIAETDRPAAIERFRRRREGKPAEEQFEIGVMHKAGHRIDVEVLVRPIQRKPLLRSVVVIRDITQRKRLDQKMLQTQKIEGLGLMAGGIAHDFNNLLTGVLGHANLALGHSPGETPQRRHLEQIQNAAVRAAELTGQLLAYSGSRKLNVQPVDLSALVQEMTEMLRVTISKKTDLRYEIVHGLPSVQGDPSQVRQVVMNLITNASEALVDGNGTIRLSTGTLLADRAILDRAVGGDRLPEGPYVWVEVADTGAGMDGATVARIFDPFFTTKFQGRGLGMAAVLGIVQGHRGAILIDSLPARGTTLRVLFPAGPRLEAAPAPDSPRTSWRGSGAVLIADDEPSVLEITELTMRELGFTPVGVVDGKAAVERFEREPDAFRLVILDMTMPRMGGREALEAIRRIRPDVPVLLCSGYSNDTEGETPLPRVGFLQKPYLLEPLREQLRRLLEDAPAR